jgi:hypothetical protein
VFRLPSDVIHVSYRYFLDDWSVRSHTFDLKYRLNLGETFYLVPALRYYKQSGADFFKYSLINGQTSPQYASADLRLAPMQSVTSGLKIGYLGNSDMEISLRMDYMQQWGEKNPAQAVGTQSQLKLFPTLQVLMYTFEFSYTF